MPVIPSPDTSGPGKRCRLPILLGLVLLLPASRLPASDLVRIGSSPASMAMGGNSALAADPLSAMSGNPALLQRLDSDTLETHISVEGFGIDADYRSKSGERAGAERDMALLPGLALALPVAEDLVIGGAIAASSGMQAGFVYTDPPGTAGVSYGRQLHESEYVVVNSSLALAWQATPDLSLGAQLGLAYNRNRLRAPYIFQSHPALSGLKVLVDLDVQDYAPSATVGLDYRISDNSRVHVAYAREVDFSADGDLDGNLGQLGLGIEETFAYDAAVQTGLPAYLTAGFDMTTPGGSRYGVQVDWINWSDTFASLPITLTNGSNAELNAFLGSTTIEDTAPLDWDDQWTVHLGAEHPLGRHLLRWGYEHSTVPVPTATMTPMTGAIFRHAVSVGTRIDNPDSSVDLYYRYSFSGDERRVNNSRLLGGEYDNTGLKLQLHSLGIGIRF